MAAFLSEPFPLLGAALFRRLGDEDVIIRQPLLPPAGETLALNVLGSALLGSHDENRVLWQSSREAIQTALAFSVLGPGFWRVRHTTLARLKSTIIRSHAWNEPYSRRPRSQYRDNLFPFPIWQDARQELSD